ncbi:deoxyguanosinetriphosphate triphosphohydrolase [Candidatus Chloroploca sp. M-50]|uniref:Deoxyguanosinetriphosphate triphosphohydrolase n=1 Tax=Candidatus Chloroploca mongolica TaxID=2528176 RepID=A0ABS4D5S5_9CHLR|nr:deoxyguanosinetriphosphate triphosphohydrolase [Candidatus Chloroploca mongolica]MBP1464792.1 deoxyguanosinetriphosphate triphosphohydrolase [Candidatus Chloroploca mongolica]
MVSVRVREYQEELERRTLSPLAAFSAEAVREHSEPPCPIRPAFQRDRDRILHSKPFRRLKHKTQVFIAPLGDHYRTRLTHTLEVTQVSRTVARALHLNEDLTEAIGLGHDLGHAPFGHAGETALTRIFPDHFRHNEQSRRIIEVLERDGRGLNLTYDVREGIYLHSKARRDIMMTAWGTAHTLEGQIIKICDSVAYINHDIDDALRAGVLHKEDLPADLLEILGHTHGERLNTMVGDLIAHNWWATGEGTPPDPPLIAMSAPILEATNRLREFMYREVYLNRKAKADDEKVRFVIETLYAYFVKYPEQLPPDLLRINRERDEPIERAVVDYIAGMTDRYALEIFKRIFVPRTWGA